MLGRLSLSAAAVGVPLFLLAATSFTVPAAGQEAEPINGQTTFAETCGGCHGAGGEGGYGPPLTANAFVADAAAFVSRILNGGELMPRFAHLTDDEIAAIVNFVRAVLNDNTDLIDAAFVAAER